LILCAQSDAREIIGWFGRAARGTSVFVNRAISGWPEIVYDRIKVTIKDRDGFSRVDLIPILESEIIPAAAAGPMLVVTPLATLRFLAAEEALRKFYANINKVVYQEGPAMRLARCIMKKTIEVSEAHLVGTSSPLVLEHGIKSGTL
jgi:hypothetical protein